MLSRQRQSTLCLTSGRIAGFACCIAAHRLRQQTSKETQIRSIGGDNIELSCAADLPARSEPLQSASLRTTGPPRRQLQRFVMHHVL